MTDRLYGGITLESVEQYSSNSRELDLAQHIRELEAEKAARGKLAEDLAHRIDVLQEGRHALAERVATAISDALYVHTGEGQAWDSFDPQPIIEEELKK